MKLFTTMKFLKIILPTVVASTLFLSCERDVKEMTLRIKSRMYVNFQEEHKVKMYEKFSISDTDLEGVVVEFLPDFAIDTLTHKAFSKSDTLHNPAAKVLIIRGRDKKEEVWAFTPGMIPHFSPRSFLAFEIIDFKTTGKYIKPEKDKAITGKEND